MATGDHRTHVAGRWPRGVWTRTICVVLVALSVGVALSAYRSTVGLTPLQRLYVWRYVRSAALASQPIIPPTRYQLLVTPRERRLATDDDVDARNDLVWLNDKRNNAEMRDDFERRIYGAPITDFVVALLWPAWVPAAGVLVLGLCFTLPKDIRRRRAIRTGERLRGRELVDDEEFNARTPADGLRVWLGRGVIRK